MGAKRSNRIGRVPSVVVGSVIGLLVLACASMSGASGVRNVAGSNLAGNNLGGFNLGGFNLGGFNLGGFNLGGFNLGGFNLGDSNLGGANVVGSRLPDLTSRTGLAIEGFHVVGGQLFR